MSVTRTTATSSVKSALIRAGIVATKVDSRIVGGKVYTTVIVRDIDTTVMAMHAIHRYTDAVQATRSGSSATIDVQW